MEANTTATEFTPPKEPTLHALWVIRNWTKLPKGNMTSCEDIVRRVHRLAAETVEAMTEEPTK